MLPAHVPLWQEFLKLHGNKYSAFEYDVTVGEGTPPLPDIPEFAKKDWLDLTKKRIDVIGFTPTYLDIIEVKPRAGLSALGQLLSYQTLFLKTRKTSLPIRLVLVTNFLTPDEKISYDRHNVLTYIL
jgi:hypothetical protein